MKRRNKPCFTVPRFVILEVQASERLNDNVGSWSLTTHISCEYLSLRSYSGDNYLLVLRVFFSWDVFSLIIIITIIFPETYLLLSRAWFGRLLVGMLHVHNWFSL